MGNIYFEKYEKHSCILNYDVEEANDGLLDFPDELYDAILGLPHERDLFEEVDALIEYAAYLKKRESIMA